MDLLIIYIIYGLIFIHLMFESFIHLKGGQEKPLKLKLNLKVGIGSSQESLPETSPSQVEERRHKHKKKKKKKSTDKDKDRERTKYVEEEVITFLLFVSTLMYSYLLSSCMDYSVLHLVGPG